MLILTEEHLAKIESLLPKPRKPEEVTMLNFLNAVLYAVEQGCQWRALPKEFGNWHTIYTRFNRWAKNGTLDKVFAALQDEGVIDITADITCIDSTSVKVHPDGTGALKKHGSQSIGRSKGGSLQRFIWLVRPPKTR